LVLHTLVGPPICAERGIHFGTVVGRRALQATVSVLDSHRSDDSGAKVGRWPTFGEVTVPKWIPLLCRYGRVSVADLDNLDRYRGPIEQLHL